MQKRKKTWYLAQGLLSCINLHQKNRWLPAHPPLTVWSLHKPQTTLSQRKCAEVYFSQELTLAAKQEHQVVLFLFPYPHWCFVLHLCNFDECFADEKKRLWNLCCLIKKKKICRARKNVTTFLFMFNKPRWICGKRCWDHHKASHHVTRNIIKFCNFLFWK